MLVIACAGVLGWLLMLGITLCLGAAAKRGDELELGPQRYLPPYCVDEASGSTVCVHRRQRPCTSPQRIPRLHRCPFPVRHATCAYLDARADVAVCS